MAISVDEFAKDFFQEILSEADAAGQFVETVFFEKFCTFLTDAGELDTADRADYRGPPNSGIRVDGYGGDPVNSSGTLSLIIADFHQSAEISRLIQTEMNAIFQRLYKFLQRALDPKWRNALEETSPAFGLADLIAQRWSRITHIRMFLLSNRELSDRVDGREADEIDGKAVTYSVWDIKRLHRFATVGHGREDIEIDLERDFGGVLPLLPAHLSADEYEAYLAVVPGQMLASIYDRWGARLLEQNVRVFLQARGNVNKGIRNTLENDPSMFFAYNNGITATAEAVTTDKRSGQLVLTGFRNLQIVNGGQTTASIHMAMRNKVDLSKVFVQMKLSIVDEEQTEEVVPKISEFANSQNRVNAADFFANHPFHVRMEDFSRRIYAPSPDGTFRETRWFYERARGQFNDARSRLAPAQRKKFDLEHPRAQLFSKTDLAKFLHVWEQKPDKVSLGAQKNFAHFAHGVGQAWKKNEDNFNEAFFREAVAKAIVFKSTEKIVSNQPWYEGGWHLMENSSRAFLDAVGKSMRQIRQAVGSKIVDPKLLTYAERLQYEGYLRRQETNEAIRDLSKTGTSIRQIVRQTGHSRKVVRDVLRGQRFDVFRTRPSSLDIWLPWLNARWEDGARNALALWREMRAQGFPGQSGIVSQWAQRRRLAEKANQSGLARTPSARVIARLLTTARDDLAKSEAILVAAIEINVPELVVARTAIGDFQSMIRSKTATKLEEWLQAAKPSLVSSFANGVEKDMAAVRNAIISPWSNGQTEGQITRLKLVKRQMYGRGKLDLLQARLIGAV